MNLIEKNYDVEFTVDDELYIGRLKLFTAKYVKQTADLIAIYSTTASLFNQAYQVVAAILPGSRAGKALDIEGDDWYVFLGGYETDEEKREILRDRANIHNLRGTEQGLQSDIDRITNSNITLDIRSSDDGNIGWILGRTQPCQLSAPDQYTYLNLRALIILTGVSNSDKYSLEEIDTIANDFLVPKHIPAKILITQA